MELSDVMGVNLHDIIYHLNIESKGYGKIDIPIDIILSDGATKNVILNYLKMLYYEYQILERLNEKDGISTIFVRKIIW